MTILQPTTRVREMEIKAHKGQGATSGPLYFSSSTTASLAYQQIGGWNFGQSNAQKRQFFWWNKTKNLSFSFSTKRDQNEHPTTTLKATHKERDPYMKLGAIIIVIIVVIIFCFIFNIWCVENILLSRGSHP